MKLIKNKTLFSRQVFLIMLDIILVNIAAYLPLYFRYEFSISAINVMYLENITKYTGIQTLLMIVIFSLCHLYTSLWKYAGIDEFTNVVYACTLGTLCHFIGMRLCKMSMPRSYYPLEVIFMIIVITTTRFAYRFLRSFGNSASQDSKNRIMIIGAGEAANIIIKEIHNSQYLDGVVVCAIDDSKEKLNHYIQGVKIVGNRHTIVAFAEKYNVTDIIIAIPTLARKEQKQIIEYCKETGCRLKILPGMYQLINEEVSVSRLRNVEIEDLLGRDPIKLNTEKIMNYVTNKIVLVTGGGGSIGSELCRQIAKYKPKQLIILDIYENNAYEIQQELKMKYEDTLDLVVLIASIRNKKRLQCIFEKYHPELIYHAAAHKHVPLMEVSPNEAIKNNVFGTLNLVQTADQYQVKRFVQISTDKAVNPTNVMGASKRICEMMIQTFNRRSKTEFVAVRFGNVLGSNGSVIPLFKKQILNGGPVTLTHPDIIRYFMTISEAVSLVLEAGAIAKGGEIFILDMGEPVKIADLAENLIRLSGYVPGRDIQIKYIGLRPGEKLYEELLMEEEGMKDTENSMIHIGKPIQMDEEAFFEQLKGLKQAVEQETKNIREWIKEIVPTYHEAEQEQRK